jgi:hypothetical protein
VILEALMAVTAQYSVRLPGSSSVIPFLLLNGKYVGTAPTGGQLIFLKFITMRTNIP